MKDRALLLIAAVVMAGASWAFWHFLGDNAFTTFSCLMLLCLAFDNVSLRRKLRSRQGK
jgi:hypothetical protein